MNFFNSISMEAKKMYLIPPATIIQCLIAFDHFSSWDIRDGGKSKCRRRHEHDHLEPRLPIVDKIGKKSQLTW